MTPPKPSLLDWVITWFLRHFSTAGLAPQHHASLESRCASFVPGLLFPWCLDTESTSFIAMRWFDGQLLEDFSVGLVILLSETGLYHDMPGWLVRLDGWV